MTRLSFECCRKGTTSHCLVDMQALTPRAIHFFYTGFLLFFFIIPLTLYWLNFPLLYFHFVSKLFIWFQELVDTINGDELTWPPTVKDRQMGLIRRGVVEIRTWLVYRGWMDWENQIKSNQKIKGKEKPRSHSSEILQILNETRQEKSPRKIKFGSDFWTLDRLRWAASLLPQQHQHHIRAGTSLNTFRIWPYWLLLLFKSQHTRSNAMHQRPGGPIALVLYAVAIVGESWIIFNYFGFAPNSV